MDGRWISNRIDEIVMTAAAANLIGVHLDQIVRLGIYTPATAV